jgi:hypothetical protein
MRVIRYLAIALAAGCGGPSLPPSNSPGPPPALKTVECKELADKILAALEKKDATEVKTLRKQVEASLGESIRGGAGINDNDFGLLLGPLSLADDTGNWSAAEKNLRELLARSGTTAAP